MRTVQRPRSTEYSWRPDDSLSVSISWLPSEVAALPCCRPRDTCSRMRSDKLLCHAAVAGSHGWHRRGYRIRTCPDTSPLHVPHASRRCALIVSIRRIRLHARCSSRLSMCEVSRSIPRGPMQFVNSGLALCGHARVARSSDVPPRAGSVATAEVENAFPSGSDCLAATTRGVRAETPRRPRGCKT